MFFSQTGKPAEEGGYVCVVIGNLRQKAATLAIAIEWHLLKIVYKRTCWVYLIEQSLFQADPASPFITTAKLVRENATAQKKLVAGQMDTKMKSSLNGLDDAHGSC